METSSKATVPVGSVLKGFAGAVSGAIACLLVQPLDVIKTRQQQQLVLNAISKYKSTLETMKIIVREEKISGLWKGTAPTLYRVIPGAGMNFFFLHYLLGFLNQGDHTKPVSKTNALLAGSCARTLATVAVLPVTVVKTRFEGFGTNVYKNTFHALKTIYLQEGTRGLFSGLVPSVLRDAPFSGIYYLFYTQTQGILRTYFKNRDIPGSIINSISGFSAAIVATLVTHPQDVIKTRLQIKPTTEGPRFRSWELCKVTYQREGIFGFYKGLMPRLIRRPLSNAITWTIYEEIVGYFRTKP